MQLSAPARLDGALLHAPEERAARLLSGAAFPVAALTAGARLVMAWTSVTTLVSKTVPDDAFYYFQIARHVARGEGVTFDGLTATNGFHPLWLAVISPLYLFFPGSADLPIHLALTLATLASLGTAAVVYAITRRLTGDAAAAAFGLLVYACNPYIILESLNGLETAVGNLCFALIALYYVVNRELRNIAQAVSFGLLGGLAILARSDNVFVVAIILANVLWRERSRAQLRLVLLAGLVATLLVAPWLVWSAKITGSVVQSSGLAFPFVVRGNVMSLHSLPMWTAVNTLAGVVLALRYSGGLWAPLPFLLVGIALVFSERRRDRHVGLQIGRLNFIVASLLALLLFHSTYRLFPRGWYFVPVALLSAVYLGVLLAYVHAAFRAWIGMALSAAAVVVMVSVNAAQFLALWDQGSYAWQGEMLAAARWLGAHAATGDRIGAFNAGIIGYWNPDRTVINLDGVANSAAFDAIRRRRLWAYVDEMQLTYVVDYEKYLFASPGEFYGTYAPYMGASIAAHAVPVARIDGTFLNSDIVVFKVDANRPRQQ